MQRVIKDPVLVCLVVELFRRGKVVDYAALSLGNVEHNDPRQSLPYADPKRKSL